MEGKQAVMFFDNNYGVSVVRFRLSFGGYGSYTDNENEWELAILYGTEDDWNISYSTDITDDVMGHLSESEVTDVMRRVQLITEPESVG